MKTHNKPVIMIDFGGVYFSKGSRIASKKIAKKYGMPEKKVYKALKDFHATQEYRKGKITRQEFLEIISGNLDIPAKNMKNVEFTWHSSYKPLKGMPQLVKKIRKHYRVVVLSGNIPERVRYLERKYGMLKHFHEHHFSFDYGLTKDDGAKFFMAAAKKMNVNPKDCILVDDKKEFLDAVKKKGAKAVLFKDAKHLEKELGKLGVKI